MDLHIIHRYARKALNSSFEALRQCAAAGGAHAQRGEIRAERRPRSLLTDAPRGSPEPDTRSEIGRACTGTATAGAPVGRVVAARTGACDGRSSPPGERSPSEARAAPSLGTGTTEESTPKQVPGGENPVAAVVPLGAGTCDGRSSPTAGPGRFARVAADSSSARTVSGM